VVGASSGIGREAALRFARRGAKVVVSARGETALETLVEEIRGEGGEATAVPADVAEWEQVRELADRAAEQYGRIDTWAHLAGVGLWARFEDTTPEEWSRVIDVTLKGQGYGARAALPHLRRAGGGALIHVSSVESQLSLPYQCAYAAAKHGINGFLKSLRLELQHEGVPISVTEIMPSSINTPIFNKARTRIGTKPKALPPLYQPSIAADAILYAAEHPVREIVVGGAGRMFQLLHILAPRVADAYLLAAGFRMQHTPDVKPDTAPTNLYEPLEEDQRVEGDFPNARSTSAYTWLKTHPTARQALGVAALGAAALLAARAVQQRRSAAADAQDDEATNG